MKHIYTFSAAFLVCSFMLFVQDSLFAMNSCFNGSPAPAVNSGSAPVPVRPFSPVSAFENSGNIGLNLHAWFSAPDGKGSITYEIVSNSFDTVASAILVNDTILSIDFVSPGQTNIFIRATSNNQSVTEKLVVGVQPRIEGDYLVSDFSGLQLEPESFWNGTAGLSSFISGGVKFHNTRSEWSWEGWAYSNMTDVNTPGYENQYSAITGGGFNPAQTNMNYGIGYVPMHWTNYQPVPLFLTFNDNQSHLVKGLFITNSTYAALSMEQGDDFTKKFGGATGNDPDYFKVLVWGTQKGVQTDSTGFYLADFRFDDNAKDYIVKTWQWLDLSVLGEIDTLFFSIASSDVGAFGINTPGYFNIDNIYVGPGIVKSADFHNSAGVKVFPNPTCGKVWIDTPGQTPLKVRILNLSGSLVYQNANYFINDAIDLSGLANGTYILQIENQLKNEVVKIIKR